jgi:cell division protein FtsI (penicillin-binding protein 3)
MTHSHLVGKRIRTLFICATLLLSLIILRLVDVQAVQANSISKRAASELERSSTLLAPRGEITDINGTELARSVAAVTIVVDQTMITNPDKAASLLSPILNIPTGTLASLLTGSKRYQIIAKNVEPAIWQNVQRTLTTYNQGVLKERDGMAKRIVGFFSERSYIREYPTGKLASSLIGFINDAGIGAAGIENSMNSMLSGQNGEYVYANGAGTIIPGSASVKVEAKPGTGLRLTIDRDIQWIAQSAISQAVKKAHAISGTVIVMDPKSGAILAQANAPTFDPSNRKTISLSSIRNPAVQDVYEPGSTGKVITVAAAMEEKKVTPTSVFTIPDQLKVGDRIFHDHEKHKTERLTTTGVLAISSNTGAIQIGQTLTHTQLHDYLTKFGIGESTGSHLPGESQGLLPAVDQWSNSTAPTVSFGQGYAVTALQATSVFATIANDGVRVPPTVVAGTLDANGDYSPMQNNDGVRVISSETASNMRTMLESVVSDNGTAPSAAIPGYRVAGKTGTAQRYDANCHCYSGYTASFIGFAPADRPQYVVSVAIQGPQGLHWGGSLGGPVFKSVMSFVLQSRHVQPTSMLISPFPLTEKELLASAKAQQ